MTADKKLARMKLKAEAEQATAMLELDLVSEKTAAAMIGQKPHTLTVWRCRFPDKAPPYVRLGRFAYYRRADLKAWIERQIVRPQQAV